MDRKSHRPSASSSENSCIQSCQRCVKSKRTCYGYQDDTVLCFRHSTYSSQLEPFDHPNTRSPSPHDSLSDLQIEDLALKTFVNDYCLTPEHDFHSHGYLDALETLLARAGSSSDLAKAANTVALASIGTKLGRSAVVYKARKMYSETLRALQEVFSSPTRTNTAESLMTTVLLGLYEVGL
jgi:hypothetical protein